MSMRLVLLWFHCFFLFVGTMSPSDAIDNALFQLSLDIFHVSISFSHNLAYSTHEHIYQSHHHIRIKLTRF